MKLPGMVNTPGNGAGGGENKEKDQAESPEATKVKGFRDQVVAQLLEQFEAFFDAAKTPIPGDKHELFRDFLAFLKKGGDGKGIFEVYSKILGRDMVYDDVKLLAMEYGRLSNTLIDPDMRSRVAPETQRFLISTYIHKRKDILEAGRVQKQGMQAFEMMLNNSTIKTFEQLDSMMHTYFQKFHIGADIQTKIKDLRLGMVDFVNQMVIEGVVDDKQTEVLMNGKLSDLKGIPKIVLEDLMKLYTLQDIVDVMATADKEVQKMNNLFSLPTLGTLYSGIKLNDKKLKKADGSLGIKLRDDTVPRDEKNEARKQAFIRLVRGKSIELADFTEKFIEADGDFTQFDEATQRLFYKLLKDNYLATNKDAFKMLQERFKLPLHDAEEFLNQLFDPTATEIVMKDAHGNAFPLGIKKTFMAPVHITNLEEFRELGLPFNIELTTPDRFSRLKEMRVNAKLGKKEAFFTIPGATPESVQELHPDFAVRITNNQTGQVIDNVYVSKTVQVPEGRDASTQVQGLPFVLQVKDGPGTLDGKPNAILPSISSDQLAQYTIEPQVQSLSLKGSDALKLLGAYALMRGGSELSAEDRAKILQEHETAKFDEATDLIYQKKKAKEEEKVDKDVEGFRKRFTEIEGDPTAEFGEDTELFVQIGDSFLPGGGNRFWRIDFVDIDQEAGTFKARLHGCEIGGQGDGEIIDEFDQTPAEIDRLLKNGFMTQVYKFKKQPTAKGRGTYIKEQFKPERVKNDNLKKFVEYVKDKIYINSLKDPESKQDLAYFGEEEDVEVTEIKGEKKEKKIKTLPLMYKVEYSDKGVEVSLKDAGWSKDMTMNEFMLFCAEKGLRGYTQKAYDILHQKADQVNEPSRGGWQWYSLGNIISGFKSAIDGVKSYLKTQDDDRAKKFKRKLYTTSFMKSLKSLPRIGEAFDDMASGIPSEIDAECWKEIETYRDECENKGGLGSAMPAKYIDNAIFANADTIWKTEPRKVAGCLLYAMGPKGGSLYFRELVKRRGQGLWVKALLGPQKREEWKLYHKALETKLKSMHRGDKDYDAVADDFSKSELRFIFNTFNSADKGANGLSMWEGIFGTKFPGYVQGQVTGGLFAKGKIDDAVKEVEGKKFSEVYSEEFLPAHGNLRLERILATQQVLGQKVESDSSRYYRWCLAMLGPLVSGVATEMFDQGYKGKYEEIAKMFGFPFGSYVHNMGSQKELVTLFDAITSSSEFKQVGSKSKKFSDAVKVDMNPNNAGRHRSTYASMETWWLDYGKQLMDKLQDYNFLFKLIAEKKAVPLGQQRNQFEVPALENYINHGVLNEDTERIQNISPESIIYEKHMFSLSPGLVRQTMDKIGGNGRYAGDAEKTAQPLRIALNGRLGAISDAPMPSAAAFNFYAKKYFQWFGSRYGNELKEFFLGAAKFANYKEGELLMQGSIRRAFDKIGAGANLPSEVANTLTKFESFFRINASRYVYPGGKLSKEFIKDILNYDVPEEKYVELNNRTLEEMKQLNKKQNSFAQQLGGMNTLTGEENRGGLPMAA